MIIYVEYVLIDNFVIDYLILKATFLITGENRKRSRLFLCAFSGSVISLIFPLIEVNAFLLVLIKFATGLFLLLISGNFRSLKDFIFNTVAFFSFTFAFGGGVIAIKNILGIESDEIIIVLVILPVYIIYKLTVKLVKKIIIKGDTESFIYSVNVFVGAKTVNLKGFLDSGNGVYFSDKPVMFCGPQVAKTLFDISILKSLNYIEIQTVNGIDKKPVFTIDRLEIIKGKKKYVIFGVPICVADYGFNLDYDIILHPNLFKENNYEIDRKTKKAS